jgi:ketosteroid isomerase-like protein
MTDLEPLRHWFSTWDTCVRAVDFAAARALFDPAVSGFGTHAAIVFGQTALEREQWSNVWPKIDGFRFDVAALHGAIAGDHAWAAVPWHSTGYHQDGSTFQRPGRATVIFRLEGARWLGLHTHFSLQPGTPNQSYGRSSTTRPPA